jgi:hypothetical protein
MASSPSAKLASDRAPLLAGLHPIAGGNVSGEPRNSISPLSEIKPAQRSCQRCEALADVLVALMGGVELLVLSFGLG